MTTRLFSIVLGALGLLTSQLHAQVPKAELLSVEKIWDQAGHNAFTDLTRFQNLFYCCFRESSSATGEGVIRILLSSTGKVWIDQGTIAEAGTDLRDPKLIVTPDNKRLYLLCAGHSAAQGRQSRYATTQDGKVWTPLQKLLAKGDTLWRATIKKFKTDVTAVALVRTLNVAILLSDDVTDVGEIRL